MNRISGSFRDIDNHLFMNNGHIYRTLSGESLIDINFLKNSGLYNKLTNNRMLIPHIFTESSTIMPEIIPLISYPYEWCFSQLKDAALLTLRINRIALEHCMVLKDASAFNIQFINNKPIFIDTASFERYIDGNPWKAYGQFCRHFLAPLVIAKYGNPLLLQTFRNFLDGIPLDIAEKYVPLFNIETNLHINFHSKSIKTNERTVKTKTVLSKKALLNIINSLEDCINKLNINESKYVYLEHDSNYSGKAYKSKKDIVSEYLAKTNYQFAWDIGANNGQFSELTNKFIVSMDSSHDCVEYMYRNCKSSIPLVMDITNPSPALGWNSAERESIWARGKKDLTIALAVIHHICITNSIPLPMIAQLFGQVSKTLIIEFIPSDDSNCKQIINRKEGKIHPYNQEIFESIFNKYFTILDHKLIDNSLRIIYLMETK